MRKLRPLLLLCACFLSMGLQAQNGGMTPIPRDHKVRIAHDLTRVSGSQFMDGGMADDSGWNLRLWFYNTPAVCVKAHAHISIYREEDIFYPCNNGNENLNWMSLQRMWFNGDRENPVNPKHYGYVVNDPNVNENDLKVCMLEFEWSSDRELTVFLPDYLFMNMPLPPNPNHVENLPVRYYIEYEADFGNTHFSSRNGITPSVTYTMYVPDYHAHITDLGNEDISSLFEIDPVPTPTPKPPHRHEIRMVSRTLSGQSVFVDGSCQTTCMFYDVISACQNQPCDLRLTRTEVETSKACESENTEHECIWAYGDSIKIRTIVEQQTINGQTCWLYYDVYRQEARCTICGVLDHTDTWTQFRRKECPTRPEEQDTACSHPQWTYFYERYRVNHRMLQTAIAPYDEDSLCFDTDTLSVRMARLNGSSEIQYTGVVFVGDRPLVITNEEGQAALTERLNQLTRDSLHVPLIFIQPTKAECQAYLSSHPDTQSDAVILKAVSYNALLYGTERQRWSILMRQCTSCGKVEIVEVKKR